MFAKKLQSHLLGQSKVQSRVLIISARPEMKKYFLKSVIITKRESCVLKILMITIKRSLCAFGLLYRPL